MFGSGWTIGRIFGVPVRVHASLLLVVPALAVWLGTRGAATGAVQLGFSASDLVLPSYVFGLLLTLAIFFTVVAHELGHALVALAQGAQVRGITLMVLGGVTETAHRDPTPTQQFWVAIAGPMVNAALGAIALAAFRAPGLPLDAMLLILYFGTFNLFVAALNMVPAFPLDGGRILRALLQARMTAERATRVAARVGRILAVAAGIIAVFNLDLVLLVVCVFVYLGAGLEEAGYDVRARLRGMPVSVALEANVASVAPDTPVDAAAEHLDARRSETALVRDLAGLHGVVAARDLKGATGVVGDLVLGPPTRVQLTDDLQDAFDEMRRTASPVVVVDDANALVGVVTGASIALALSQTPSPQHHEPVTTA